MRKIEKKEKQSYLDWEKSFKIAPENALKIPNRELKDFLKNWKEKNLKENKKKNENDKRG